MITLLAGAVVTMTDRGVLTDQAVTIADGRITGIAPREAADLSSVDGVVLDWRDRTIVPGLADCHAHVDERAHMLLNLAHGVTFLRNTWGKPWHLQWQREVAAGREVGPFVVTTSPIADGLGRSGTTIWPHTGAIDSRETAHAAVQRWASMGFQAVKCYSWLDAEGLGGLGEACRDAGIPLIGHCPQALTIDEAIDLGQTCFEHLNNYEYGALQSGVREQLDAQFPVGLSRLAPEAGELLGEIDEVRLADLAQRIADEGITSCPTLVVWDRILGKREFDDPRLRYVDPVQVGWWAPANDHRFRMYSPEQLRRTDQVQRRRTRQIIASLRDAGARVLVGIDAPNAFVFHGSSVVEEMEILVSCGYTPVEVLEMATRIPADYLGLRDRGRIEAGCVADMVAVAGDPLASVSALRDPVAVVVGGTVFDREALNGLLAEAEGLLHAEPEVRWQSLGPEEDVVGEYAREEFGQPAGRSLVSCCSPGPGLSQWREQIAVRGRTEDRTTVIDERGHLVSSTVRRYWVGGTDVATVARSAEGSTYAVSIAPQDGSVVETTLSGPFLPGEDLGAPALLAAARLAGDEPLPVLTLAGALATGMVPSAGRLEHGDEGLVQLTLTERIAVTGDEALEDYGVSAPMSITRFRRIQ